MNRMKPDISANSVERSPIPSKWDLQASFLASCCAESLSNEQVVERASVFPMVARDEVKIGRCCDL